MLEVKERKRIVKYTPVGVKKSTTKMDKLLLFIKDPMLILSVGWAGITLSDVDVFLKIVASLIVIVAGVYNLYKNMKKNGDI